MQRVYHKVEGEGLNVHVEEKFKKVDDTISQIQVQVEEIELKIKLHTPPKEREIIQKVNEALETLHLLSGMKPNCQVLNQITLDVYDSCSMCHKCRKINR